ncbi:MAG: RNA polymerase sigma factor [Verrucomicrobiales bacterium]
MESPPHSFSPTRWTLVVQASGHDDTGRTALRDLCAAYYEPVVAFLRREGRTEDDARDLAHGFFERLLAGGSLRGANPERGRFRSYLLGAVKHFVRDERARDHAAKRGGGQSTIPLQDTASGMGEPDPTSTQAEIAFDRQWAFTVIGRALDTVAADFRVAGKESQFAVLKPWITGNAPRSQSEAAADLGLTEGAVRVAIHRLREQFRNAVTTEIAQTTFQPDEAADELRHLIAVVSAD